MLSSYKDGPNTHILRGKKIGPEDAQKKKYKYVGINKE